jgi:hypothetical protein
LVEFRASHGLASLRCRILSYPVVIWASRIRFSHSLRQSDCSRSLMKKSIVRADLMTKQGEIPA